MIRQDKLVSIGMPVYNGEEFLRQALDSLLSQSYKNFELIISDNASLDDTPKICEEYIAKDRRIRYVRQIRQIGGVNNFEFVLKQTRGEYFMWAAHDDVWDSRFIEECIERFSTNKGVIMVFSNFAKINKFGDITEVYTPQNFFPFEKDIYQRLKRYLLFWCRDGKANLMYGLWVRKELIQVPLFSSPSWGSDMNFVFRALSRGRFGLVDKMLFSKRVVSHSFSKRPFPIRVFIALLSRVEILLSPYFYTYMSDIFRIKQLTFVEKLKLIFYTFLTMCRLFFSYKV